MMEIEIETLGDGVETIPEDVVAELPDMLATLGAHGAAVSAGGISGGIGATFGLELWRDTDADGFGEYARSGVVLFEQACEKLGLAHGPVAHVAVLTEEIAARDLDQEPETFLGVSELASELGVSRQRVSELRTRSDFPAPIAELAAGPVWRLSTLKRFIGTWERRPGRPRRSDLGSAERR